MSYDLHLHRRDFFADDKGAGDITYDDWMRLQQDPDFLARNHLSATWTAHPDDVDVQVRYDEGVITVERADAPTIEASLRWAALLSARLQGDDGEFYEPQESTRSR